MPTHTTEIGTRWARWRLGVGNNGSTARRKMQHLIVYEFGRSWAARSIYSTSLYQGIPSDLRPIPPQVDSDLKNCGKIVRNSSRSFIWYWHAGVGGGWMPSSTRWTVVQPSSAARLQFVYESSVYVPCQSGQPHWQPGSYIPTKKQSSTLSTPASRIALWYIAGCGLQVRGIWL